MEEIVNNPNTDDDVKLELKTKLIDSLKLKRYCCKVRVMTFKQLTDIIK
jgi:DNA-directed RNA polymerase subunit N (RpoN/RPB10)